MIHNEPFSGAGQVFDLDVKGIEGKKIRVEDYWDRVYGKSWMHSEGNPAVLKFAMRSGFAGLPLDNEVVYGKVDSIGHLVHVSELGERRS